DVPGEGPVDVDAHPPDAGAEVRPERSGDVLDVVDRDLIARRHLGHAGTDQIDDTGRLVPRHDGELVGAEASLLEEEIRAAHAARVDPDPRLARARHRVLTLDELERGADGGK